MKTQENQRVTAHIAVMAKNLKGQERELEAANQYLSDLEHACVDGDSTYDDRKAARDQEIAALKTAEEGKTEEDKAEEPAEGAEEKKEEKEETKDEEMKEEGETKKEEGGEGEVKKEEEKNR